MKEKHLTMRKKKPLQGKNEVQKKTFIKFLYEN